MYVPAIFSDLMSTRFRWVSLQLQNLCNPYCMKVEAGVKAELGKLPKTLSDIYATIYNQIEQSGPNSRRIGKKALIWTLAATQQLSTSDLIAVVSVDDDGSQCEISVQSVLDMTCNLLVEDSNVDTFRFAHLSVREYLETLFHNDSMHLEPAMRCLETVCPSKSSKSLGFHSNTLGDYARSYWLYHCSKLSTETPSRFLLSNLCLFLFSDGLLGTGVSKEFFQWTLDMKQYWPDVQQYRISKVIKDPFLVVCKYGFSEVVRALPSASIQRLNNCLLTLEHSAHVEYYHVDYYHGMNGLHVAAYWNQSATVKALLDQGVDVETTSLRGKTALHLAAERGSIDVIQTLIDYGANPHATTFIEQRRAFIDHTQVPSFTSSRSDDCGPVRPVSSLGFRDGQGGYESVLEEDSESAIHYAAYSGSKEAVQILLRCGVDINARSSQGATPLHKALEGGHEDIAETLLDAGAHANLSLLYSRTLLHFAAALGQERVTAYLIRRGADPSIRDVFGNYPFEVALQYNHESIAEMLRC